MILATLAKTRAADGAGGGKDILAKVEEPPPGLRTLYKCPMNICKGEQASEANRVEVAKG